MKEFKSPVQIPNLAYEYGQESETRKILEVVELQCYGFSEDPYYVFMRQHPVTKVLPTDIVKPEKVELIATGYFAHEINDLAAIFEGLDYLLDEPDRGIQIACLQDLHRHWKRINDLATVTVTKLKEECARRKVTPSEREIRAYTRLIDKFVAKFITGIQEKCKTIVSSLDPEVQKIVDLYWVTSDTPTSSFSAPESASNQG
jgi:hypothetical protein